MRIKQLREQHNLQQKCLSAELGVSQSVVSAWEKGTKLPSFKNTVKIAEYFEVSTDFLLGKTNDPKSGSGNNIIRIPVLGSIPAGVPIEAIEDVLDYEEVPANWGRGGREYFALKIKGDSMEPKYQDKDVVIFQKAQTCDSGQDCAVIVNGDEATFKKVLRNTKGITLQPINTNYEPIFYTNDEVEELPVQVIGIAEEIRRKA